MTTTHNEAQLCEVCGLRRAEHEDANIHHEFSEDGKLHPKKKPVPPDYRGGPTIRVEPEQTTAARLAAILHTRGIIDDVDLVYVLTGGHDGSDAPVRDGTGGDIQVRPETVAD